MILASQSLTMKLDECRVIEFRSDGTPITTIPESGLVSIRQANHDRFRFDMAKQRVAETCLAELHRLGRQGLSEILRSFFSLMKIRQPNDFNSHFDDAMAGGVVKIIESAFKPTGRRTVQCKFDKFFKDKGKCIPQGHATKHEGGRPLTEADFGDGVPFPEFLRKQGEIVPVDMVSEWTGGPVLHKCVLRSTVSEVEYEGVSLLPPSSLDPDEDGQPISWMIRQTEILPVWTPDMNLTVFKHDPLPIFREIPCGRSGL